MIDIFKNTFPELPVKNIVFIEHLASDYSIGLDIKENFQSKRWSDITLGNWTNAASVITIVHTITPSSFHYILPSIILGGLKDFDYIDWGIRSILPANNKYEARGEWWNEYFGLFSLSQRKTIECFLDKTDALVSAGSEDEYLLSKAKELWK